ncbi:hypothetical protein GP486_002390 [Trichoglossum hirsutum]|uniref:Uncharacterized protein n=1 Tax=Trichoglossum hirsutum TaxID=265104 RepID=A0A9P8RRQ5_9PEZI|nr:hypothetical protein GP486_002390 [Trichoglossum hirsutum]
MSGLAKEYAVCILVRLTIDKCIMESGELQVRIEDAVASLVSSISEEQRELVALAFFFNDSSYLTLPEDDLLELRRITRELEKPEFSIDNNTDYIRIASLISILDICIDNGASPSRLDKDQETMFNIDIDNLARKLKSMFTKIVDTGASYMARTEAKEVLERVHYRLVFAVRTKERLKKSIFQSTTGIDMDNRSKPQSTMTKFLSRGP